ncbi:hypothetical protein FOA43_004736 [Brettanomyces nanus]|uniref:Prokaryotic-type class I peptide chain release factors domain-containing protein n=1 Tax=Eeniella nana TaxID=13502 RepID=A0A875RYI1_EENNA|nr:uncharacterized protein FOA43_004736 [Brettanomyces nanus]QPG77327.1 hypothetical protein FOA43_004736 [Brettanomyces nanus]
MSYFDVAFTHSSGKGGQHINTTDSKAQLRMSTVSWYESRGRWIDSTVFDQIMHNYNDKEAPQIKKFPYFTVKGDVLVESQKTRYRDKNLQDCLDKFVVGVKQCGQLRQQIDQQTKQEWQKYKKRDNEQRVRTKKHVGDKKQLRKRISLDDI